MISMCLNFLESSEFTDICNRVQNGEIIMRQCVGSIQANLNNMTLLGVAPLQNGGDERVPEKKYGIIIYSKVTLCGKEVPLKVGLYSQGYTIAFGHDSPYH